MCVCIYIICIHLIQIRWLTFYYEVFKFFVPISKASVIFSTCTDEIWLLKPTLEGIHMQNFC